jgi:ABC transporter related protein
MESQYILKMERINKIFPGVKALDNVDFKVKYGETMGLVGANGAGKSTLIKILSGAYQRSSGGIYFDGKEVMHNNTIEARKAGIAVIYQEFSLIDSLSVAENIFLNEYDKIVDWSKMQKKAESLCNRFHLNIDVKENVSRLSIGQKQLVEIIKAISIGTKLVVMDEPSATLSEEEFAILLKVIKDLKKEGISIVYVSHRLDEIFQVCDRVTILRDGKNVTTQDVDGLMMDQLVEFMIGHKVDTEKIINNNVDYNQIPVLSMKKAKSKFIGPIDFDVFQGEVFGIYGLVGSGRTEILKMIFGVDRLVEGSIFYKDKEYHCGNPAAAIKQGIGLVPENRKKEGLIQILPVWENAVLPSLMQLAHNFIINIGGMKKIVSGYIDKIEIKTPSENALVRNLSGGNQQKVVISKWLIKDCDFLLVDEPTQGIDVGAKDQIYKIINDMSVQGKSIIIVSSELDELVKICNRISVMYEGKQIKIFEQENIEKNTILATALTGRA